MLVLKPRQPNDEGVQYREKQQPQGMREAVSISLIKDEQAKNRNGGRIVARLLAP